MILSELKALLGICVTSMGGMDAELKATGTVCTPSGGINTQSCFHSENDRIVV